MISERIKEIRNSHNLSREKFGNEIGVSRGVIENIEYNRSEIKDLYIQLICKKFNINEHWLRTGEGEKYIDHKKQDEVTNFITDLVKNTDDTTREIIFKLSELNKDDFHAVAHIIRSLSEKE